MRNEKRNQQIQRLVISAAFCALVFAGTWIHVPLPLGNVNLGDGVLLVCAWTLGGPWAVCAAAIGAMLADLTAGFAMYAPATIVIKAVMVIVAILAVRLFEKLRVPSRVARVLSAVCAELVMILGYFGYEALVLSYGLGAAVNIPFNAVQGVFGTLLACVFYEVLVRVGLFSEKDR